VKDINKIIKNEMKAKPFCAYFTLKWISKILITFEIKL
jgi:hypothetical protein